MDERKEAEHLHSLNLYFRKFHKSLGIYITMKCPLECAHCWVDSSPRRTEFIDKDLILRRLEEIGQAGKVKQLIITGGEPFLAREPLKEILQVAKKYHLRADVDTSAYWATSVDQANEVLTSLPGITHLSVSADEYHEPFVSIERVKYALLAAIDCKIHPTLMARAMKRDNDPFIVKLHDFLGQDLLNKIEIDFNLVVPSGRGKNLFQRDAYALKPEFPSGPCNCVQSSIYWNGTVLACCNTNVGLRHKSYQLGNLYEKSFPEISEEAERYYILHAIRVWGPKRLAEILVEHGFGPKLKGLYGGLCSLCEDIMSKPELVRFLQEKLNEDSSLKGKLALGRYLRFGESQMIDDTDKNAKARV